MSVLNMIKNIPQVLPKNSILLKLPLIKYQPIVKNLNLSPFILNYLIKNISRQGKFYAVGVNGLPSNKEIGSQRISGFSSELASYLDLYLSSILPEKITIDEYTPVDVKQNYGEYIFKGCSPYFRYMEYSDKGSHNIHYDSPHYFNHNTQTIFSGVLYLNTVEHGGETVFVLDLKNLNKPFIEWDTSDWSEIHKEEDVLLKVKPEESKVLLFYHQLPHGVDVYKTSSETRKIIRFDVYYEKH